MGKVGVTEETGQLGRSGATPTVAIIGAGNMGGTHARAYREAGGRVTAVCDVDAARAAAFASAHRCRAYTDADEMLDVARPIAVSICTPPVDHRRAAEAALSRGIAVLCEKPLADSVAAGHVIVSAAARGGAPCMTGFCHRFHEPVLQVKGLLDTGSIGRPVLFRSRFAARFASVERTWFSDRSVSGGGALMDTGVHSIDLYRFLIGDIARVSAELATETPGLGVEDNSVVLVNGPAGIPGVIEASWTTPAGGSLLVIYGTEGTAMVDYTAGAFGVARIQRAGASSPETLPRAGRDRFAAEIAHFLASIASGDGVSPDARDGLRAMDVIDAAYRVGAGAGSIVVPAGDGEDDEGGREGRGL